MQMGMQTGAADAASALVVVVVLVLLLLGESVLVTMALVDGRRVLWLGVLLLGIIIVVVAVVFGLPLLTRPVG